MSSQSQNPEHPTIDALLRHSAWIGALARSLVANDDDADDLVQEIFVAALRRQPRKLDVRGWIHSVARNLARSKWRSDQRRALREAEAARLEAVPSIETVIEKASLHRCLVSSLLELSEPYKSTLLLYYFEGLRPGLIARKVGVPVETVRTRLKRGRNLLKSTLDRLHGGNREAWTLPVLLYFAPKTAAASGALGSGILAGALAKGAGALAILAVAVAVILQGFLGDPPGEVPVRSIAKRDAGAGAVEAPPDPRPPDVTAGKWSRGPEVDQPPEPRPDPPRSSSASPYVFGRITDPAGNPVARALIRALRVHVPGPNWKRRGNALAILAATRTDADGWYAFARFESPVLLKAVAPDHALRYRLVSAGGRHDLVLGRPGELTGIVTRAGTGDGCSDAVVTIFESKSQVNLFGFGNEGTVFSFTTRIAYAQARTDADGKFRITNVAADTYRLAVFPRDNPVHRPAGFRVRIRPGETSNIDLSVPAWATVPVTGKVVDGAGEGVPGIPVAVSGNPNRSVETDEEGCYRIPGVAGERLLLLVRVPGFLPTVRALEVPCRGIESVDLALRRPGSIRGRVQDASGYPMSGARVTTVGDFRAAVTDKNGAFVLNGLPTGRRRLVVEVAGHPCGVPGTITVEAGRTTDVGDIPIRSGGTVSGRIAFPGDTVVRRHSLALRPVAVPGSARANASTRPIFSILDANGRFVFKHVPPGSYRFATWLGSHYHTFPEVIRVEDGVQSAVNLTTVGRGRPLAGMVMNPMGEPVVHARVEVDAGEPGAAEDVAWTDKGGRFRFFDLRDTRYRLLAESQGRYISTVVSDVRPGGPDLSIVLERRRSVMGRVVMSPTDRPATSFWVRVFPHQDVSEIAAGIRCKRFFHHPEGKFTLGFRPDPLGPPPLLDGVYDVEAGASANLVSPPAKGIRFGTDASRRALILRLAPGGTLDGRVVDTDGRPAAGTRILVYPGNRTSNRRYVVHTDASGRFRLAPLYRGTYRIEATHDRTGAATAVAVLRPDSRTRLTLRLRPAARLAVCVQTRGGRPLRDALVALRPPAWPAGVAPHRGHTDGTGVVTFDGLLPGPLVLAASHPDHTPAEMNMMVAARRDQRVHIHPGDPGTVEVTVTGPDGRGVAGAEVAFLRNGRVVVPDEDHHRQAFAVQRRSNPGLNWFDFMDTVVRTDAEGRLTRRHLIAGRWMVRVRAPRFVERFVPVVVRGGIKTPVVVELIHSK